MSTLALGDTRTLALATLGAMTSKVAHEVKNLLAGIELYAAMLAEQCAAERELAPLSGRLLAGVKQLGAVAANLLSVSRRPDIDPVPVELARLVADTISSVDLAVRGTGIRLHVSTGKEKAWVLGDPERLRQALLNLVLNAIQAMPDGGVLAVGTRRSATHACLVIRDTGIGMDRATLRRSTEPFFTTRTNGTGLGLAIVREVADAHGARVRITSRPGRGTTVRLRLPLAATDSMSEVRTSAVVEGPFPRGLQRPHPCLGGASESTCAKGGHR
jgi:signal transduction histidine kinase